jgi:hypothetical protein
MRATQIEEAIYAAYEARERGENRPHLGASRIGIACERAIWYGFRHALRPRFPGRVLRLFQTGHLEEPRMIEDLRSIGADVFEVDPDTGRQWQVSMWGGHFGGSADGLARGVPGMAPDELVLLEFKTHAKSFASLDNPNGVRGSKKPDHYAQMQVYMHLLPVAPRRALYMAKDKATDELYCEVIEYDQPFARSMVDRAERVIFGDRPPARISENPAWWQCTYCDYREVCHGQDIADENCRTCAASRPLRDGSWECTLGRRIGKACEQWLPLPGMTPGEVTDHTDDWTEGKAWLVFTSRSGARYRMGVDGVTHAEARAVMPWAAP